MDQVINFVHALPFRHGRRPKKEGALVHRARKARETRTIRVEMS